MPAPGCYQEEIALFICEKQEWKEPGDGCPALCCHGAAMAQGAQPGGCTPACPRWEPKGAVPVLTRWGGDKVTLRCSALRLKEFLLRVSVHNVRMSPSCNFTPKRQRVKSLLMTSNCFRKMEAILRRVELSYTEANLFRAQKRIANTARQ